MIFDAVHAFAHGLHAMGGSGSLAAPNVTCELLNSWAGGRRLYEHINAVGDSQPSGGHSGERLDSQPRWIGL